MLEAEGGAELGGGVDGAGVGHGHAEAVAELEDGAGDGVELEGAAGVEVLQHRGAVLAGLGGGAGDALVDLVDEPVSALAFRRSAFAVYPGAYPRGQPPRSATAPSNGVRRR